MAYLNARIPDGKKKEIDVALATRGVTLQVAVADAIDLWLDPSRKPEGYRGPNAEWHRKLDVILTKGGHRDVVGIQQNIDWAVRVIAPGTTTEVPVDSGRATGTETVSKHSVATSSPDNISLQQLLVEIQNDPSEDAVRRLGMVRTTLEGWKRDRDARAKKEAAKSKRQKPDTRDRREQTGS